MKPLDEEMLKEKSLEEYYFYSYGIYRPTRTIYIGGESNAMQNDSEISLAEASRLFKALHVLENDSFEEITIVLNSEGGIIYNGMAMYDLVKSCQSPIRMIALGACMSMATVLLQSADTRIAYPNTTFMIHEVSDNPGDEVISRLKKEIVEDERLHDMMLKIYEDKIKIPLPKFKRMFKAGNYYMPAEKALEIGLIDQIVTSPKETKI